MSRMTDEDLTAVCNVAPLDQYWAPSTLVAEFAAELLELRALRDKVAAFINERSESITAIENCPAGNEWDYYRWQGHAEARRVLAQQLGWTVPHNPGDETDMGIRGEESGR